MSNMKLTVRKYEWRQPYVTKMIDLAGGEGVVNAAEAILADAAPFVPFEDGDLLASGKAGQNREVDGRFNNEGFVSYDTPYAVHLHEHPEYNFQGSGEGKWLEHAMQRRASRMIADIAPPLVRTLRMP